MLNFTEKQTCCFITIQVDTKDIQIFGLKKLGGRDRLGDTLIDSLLYSQQYVTGPYQEPVESIPHHDIQKFLQIVR
jgi:hypothetical protein